MNNKLLGRNIVLEWPTATMTNPLHFAGVAVSFMALGFSVNALVEPIHATVGVFGAMLLVYLLRRVKFQSILITDSIEKAAAYREAKRQFPGASRESLKEVARGIVENPEVVS